MSVKEVPQNGVVFRSDAYAGTQLEIFEDRAQSMERIYQKVLKEGTTCGYCFSDSLVEEILWDVY